MMALGAMEAIRAAGKTGKIRVIGFDAWTMRARRSSRGRWKRPWRSSRARWAAIAIESAVKVLEGRAGDRLGKSPCRMRPGHRRGRRERDDPCGSRPFVVSMSDSIGWPRPARPGLRARSRHRALPPRLPPSPTLASLAGDRGGVRRAGSLHRSAGAHRRSEGGRGRDRQPDAHAHRRSRVRPSAASRRSAKSRRRFIWAMARKMKERREAVAAILFQMGLMRRFDRGYATAKEAGGRRRHRHTGGVQVLVARSLRPAWSTRSRPAAAA